MTDRIEAPVGSEENADHVELTVQRMAELHAQSYAQQSRLQKRIGALTRSLARPRALMIIAALAVLWMLGNLAAVRVGRAPLDAPPFAWLELAATVIALLTTVMILATQAQEEEAARRRSQLTLQLASLTEQKIAKVISLLEEQRRDNALLPSRDDPEAEEMAESADPAHVLERIKDTHD